MSTNIEIICTECRDFFNVEKKHYDACIRNNGENYNFFCGLSCSAIFCNKKRKRNPKNKSERVKGFLGMPHGTASSRLKKMIMHDMAQKLGLDKCFHCGKRISLGEFSLEHKIPWMYIDPELFWDLDNIAFSHAKCNSEHVRTQEQMEEDRINYEEK